MYKTTRVSEFGSHHEDIPIFSVHICQSATITNTPFIYSVRGETERCDIINATIHLLMDMGHASQLHSQHLHTATRTQKIDIQSV
jgi:hypothetical protein